MRFCGTMIPVRGSRFGRPTLPLLNQEGTSPGYKNGERQTLMSWCAVCLLKCTPCFT